MSEKVKEKRAKGKGPARRRVAPPPVEQRRRTPGQSTISSKNQITLPVAVLREVGFGPGTRLEAIAGPRGEIILRDVDELPSKQIERVAGMFSDLYPPNYLEELRRSER